MKNVPRHDVHAHDEATLREHAEVRILIQGFDRVFLAEASLAAERAAAAVAANDVTGVAGATAAAVLLAATACEARFSEHVTRNVGAIGKTRVKELLDERDAFKAWRELIGTKLTLAGDSPLSCLIKLRDLVAHRGVEFLPPGEWPKRLKDCVAKEAIPVTKSREIDWTSGLYQQQVAKWAYETAAEWLAVASRLGID